MSISVNREILRLAIPNILSNISVPLISAVDTALMGRLSIEHLGAVGLGSMIFNFIYWNFGFLRMGTTGITAQSFGRGDHFSTRLILTRSLGIALIISIVLICLYIPLCQTSLYLMNVSETQVPLVSTYFSIRICAAPATLMLYVFMGWFFGMQNAVYPLIITVIINIINLILSYLFVVELNWDINGVAWGTVIAQYIGVILSSYLLYKKYRSTFSVRWNDLKGKFQEWTQVLRINSFLFVRTVCLTFAFAVFYAESSETGATILATNVVLLQFLNWISYGIDGFAFASESLVGRFFGAKDQYHLKKVITYSFKWGFILALFYALLFYYFDEEIVGIFTNSAEVLNYASELTIWMIALPLMAFGCYIWDGVYIGLTEVKMMMYAMILSLTIYLVMIYGKMDLGVHHIWISLIFFLFVRGVIQACFWKLSIEKRIYQIIDL